MQYMVQVLAVPPIDFDFNISSCDRVRECTFMAHWLSDTSPRKTRESWAQATHPMASRTATSQAVFFRIICCFITSSISFNDQMLPAASLKQAPGTQCDCLGLFC